MMMRILTTLADALERLASAIRLFVNRRQFKPVEMPEAVKYREQFIASVVRQRQGL